MWIRKEGDAIAIKLAELRQFIGQKRVLREEKIMIAKEIITAAEIIIAEYGHFEEVGGLETQVFKADHKSFSLLYTTPFNKIIGNKYGVDIWDKSTKNSKKVFSARWEPLEIIRFDRGPWIQDVLFSAYHKVIME
jgi:hypothetical protein